VAVAAGKETKQRKTGKPVVGKQVGGAVYIHKDAASELGELAERVIEAAGRVPGFTWNVAKIEKKSVSLLLYQPFETAFPALLESARVHLATNQVTRIDYRRRSNPPILHRKELLLSRDDPRLPQFRALTAAAEEHGLFSEPTKIGTLAAWTARISSAGLVLRNNQLVKANELHFDVARHRTAIIRRDLSQPMQLMMRLGVVRQHESVFDYGCGQGEDIAALQAQGLEAFGWDPHHAPDGPRRRADVVNLGFVLNVIEDSRERAETLKAAWSFAKRALCIAVMIQGRADIAGHKPYRDGFLSSRGTFQKYFDQQEFRAFVESVTGESPLALAPGIVVIFRDKDLEQEVLLRRRSRSLIAGVLPRPPQPERAAVAKQSLRERIAPMLDLLRETAISLGRLPEVDEVSLEVLKAIRSQRISWSRALESLQDNLASDESFSDCARARREDLLVHLALLQFPGSTKYRSLPRSIQADIKAFFRNHAAAQEEGRRLLFATGDRGGVRADIDAAVSAGLGGFRGDRAFRFRATTLPRLPGRLRVLVGCAEVLQGGVDACDFVDIDLEKPRVSMVTCDNVARDIPFVVERLVVDLARLRVTADKREPNTMPVYFKSRFLTADDPLREGQNDIESRLMATGLFVADRAEPSWDKVELALKELQTSI
jgi:DNA phosphorothioation-associated putative methyltransferase